MGDDNAYYDPVTGQFVAAGDPTVTSLPPQTIPQQITQTAALTMPAPASVDAYSPPSPMAGTGAGGALGAMADADAGAGYSGPAKITWGSYDADPNYQGSLSDITQPLVDAVKRHISLGDTDPADVPAQKIPQATPSTETASLTMPASTSVPATLPGSGPAPIGPDTPLGAAPETAPEDHYHALAASLVGGESGGNANSKNPTPGSTATGTTQLTDLAWSDYLKNNPGKYSPGDKNNPQAQIDASAWQLQQTATQIQTATGRAPTDQEVIAGHLLGPDGAAAFAANPTANAFQTYCSVAGTKLATLAFAQNGALLNKNATCAQTLGQVGQYYAAHSGQAGATAPSASGPTTTGTPDAIAASSPASSASQAPAGADPAALQQLQSIGIPTLDPSQYRSTLSDKLFAMSAGLLGAPTLGMGLSRGLQGVNALRQEDRQGYLKAQSDVIVAARANAQLQQYQLGYGLKNQEQANKNAAAGMAAQPKPFGQPVMGPAGADGKPTSLQPMRDPTTGKVSYVPVEGTATNVARAEQGAERVQGQLTGETAGSTALAKTAVKDNLQDANTIDNNYDKATSSAPVLQQLQTLLQDPKTAAGPSVVQAAKRAIALQFGISVDGTDPSSVDLANQIQQQAKISGLGRMKESGLRGTQGEFKEFMKTVSGLDTQPANASIVLGNMQAQNQRAAAIHQAYHDKMDSMDADGQHRFLTDPNQMSSWLAQQDEAYAGKRGMNPATGTTTPNIQPNASGPGYSGVKFAKGADGVWRQTTAQ